jgi:hypothetical protein
MADLEAAMRDGFAALVDEIPQVGSLEERGVWCLGYLYGMAAGPIPTGVRVFRDGVLGTVFEVDEQGGAKVGYVMLRQEKQMVPVRVYVR